MGVRKDEKKRMASGLPNSTRTVNAFDVGLKLKLKQLAFLMLQATH